jgi:transposase
MLYTIGNASLGMISILLNVSNVAVLKWIRKEALNMKRLEVSSDSKIIAIDEMWHFINGKKTKYGYGKPMIWFQEDLYTGLLVGVMIQHAKNF